MKRYLKYFRFMFIGIAILLVIYIAAYVNNVLNTKVYKRTNTSCTETERVFDYADKLSDSEENALRELIAKNERLIGCDIVLVTINEDIGNIMNFADDFYDDHNFGYTEDTRDGTIYVDNWYDGEVWFCTTGKALDKYSNNMINSLVNSVTSITNDNPYKAYERYVNRVYSDMESKISGGTLLSPAMIVLFAVIVTLIYFCMNFSGKKGKKTVAASTYVNGGKPVVNVCHDQFINKTVTSRKIETSSSSSGGSRGGGGSHRSSSGRSHGGGGGRH